MHSKRICILEATRSDGGSKLFAGRPLPHRNRWYGDDGEARGCPALLWQFFLKQLVRQLSFIPLKLIVKSPTHGQPMPYRQEYALEGAV